MRPLDAALAYAEKFRWPIFPRPNGRFVKGGHGFKDATLDPEKITAWWTQWPDAWINIPTGPVSRIVVLDIDIKNGVNGLDTLTKLGKPLLPATPRVLTPHGGLHLYFADNPNLSIGCTVGELGPGLDVKGHGGSVPLPTPGNDYVWVETYRPLKVPFRTAPGWLGTRSHSVNANGKDLTPKHILDNACELISNAQANYRNETINREGFMIGSMVKARALKERESLHQLMAATATMAEATKGNKHKAAYDLKRAFYAGLANGRWGKHQ